MSDPNTSLGRWLPPRRDALLIALMGLIYFVVLGPLLGIWEPWEADVAAAVDAIRGGGWLQVVQPEGDGIRVVPELPFGLWPSALATAVLGTGEMGLRLPGMLLALPVLLLAYSVGRRTWGRLAGWAAALGLLCMPLFVFHSRLALGTAVGMHLSALAALTFLRALVDDEAGGGWRWLGWVSFAGAGLAAGVPGLLGPAGVILAGALGATGDRRAAFARMVGVLPFALAAALLAVGWWRAAAHLPGDLSVRSLLLWANGLDGSASPAKRPTFEIFVHQIGFGLFPLAAFLPLAFADLIWGERAEGESEASGVVTQAAAAWFALGFLGPAIGLPIGHAGFFLAAPAVALVVGAYLARAMRAPPQPLWALAAVVMLALLDSNLKHQTQSLAETLVATSVDAFPPKLPGWTIARVLDFALLGVVLLYQGGLLRWIKPAVRAVFYPSRAFGWAHPLLILIAAGCGGVAMKVRPGALDPVLLHRAWGRLSMGLRQAIVFLVFTLVFLVVIRMVHALRVARLDGQRAGLLMRATEGLEGRLRRPGAAWALLAVLLVAWGGFLNLVVAATLSTNFSQKEILDRYEALAHEGEPLYRYQVDGRNSSFYADRLELLDGKRFRALAQDEARFFAIVPRDRLARINDEFRTAANKTVPVLDDRSYRFLLISNRIEDGEEDHNPITRALVDTLPDGVTRTPHVFEDQIELVGWALDPPRPHPGSELTISMFWRAKKKISGRWKVFVHIDAAGQRIHGDHDPVAGLFPTDNWKPGDLIRDDHRVLVKRSISPARFTFYAGLYRGNTRMKITTGDKDTQDRAKLGTISVR